MTNKIGYNQYPDREEFINLYSTYTQQELADYYECTKKRINKWIKHFGLQLRKQGGGNNRKYNIDKKILCDMIADGYSNSEICEILNIKITSLYNWLKRYDLKRERKVPEYESYKRKVRWLTEKTYANFSSQINPNKYPRTLCGVDGGYHLDHIKGVYECYVDGDSVEFCSSLENLQMLPWRDNLNKRNYNNYNRGIIR